MCDNCFIAQIESFPDQASWTSFDLELTKKLEREHLKHVKFIRDFQRDKDDGVDIYECASCKQCWKLKMPYEFNGGFFLKLGVLEKLVTRLTKGQKIILGIFGLLLLLVIRIIYWLSMH